MFHFKKILFLVLSMLTITRAQGKPSSAFCGNWFLYTRYSLAFLELNKDSTYMLFTSGCTDRGTNHPGTYNINGDTLTLSGSKDTFNLFLYDNQLFYSSSLQKETMIHTGGYQKTLRITPNGAAKKGWHQSKKNHRKDHRRKSCTT